MLRCLAVSLWTSVLKRTRKGSRFQLITPNGGSSAVHRYRGVHRQAKYMGLHNYFIDSGPVCSFVVHCTSTMSVYSVHSWIFTQVKCIWYRCKFIVLNGHNDWHTQTSIIIWCMIGYRCNAIHDSVPPQTVIITEYLVVYKCQPLIHLYSRHSIKSVLIEMWYRIPVISGHSSHHLGIGPP